MTQAKADRMFLDGMAELGVAWPRRWLMYAAVKAFGWLFWNRCAKCLAGQPHAEHA